MLKRLAIFMLVASVCLAGDTEEQHKALASQRTPREWHTRAVWRFVTTPPAGKLKPEILTFRVTDQPGVSCLGGWNAAWHKFVVLDGRVPMGPPIYQVEGRALRINLSGSWCDDYDIIDGVLIGDDFTGQRSRFGLGAPSEVVGTVQGSCVRQ
jgi:hypothetical protein